MNAFGAALMIWLSNRGKPRACARCGVSPQEECAFAMRFENQAHRDRIETAACYCDRDRSRWDQW